MRTRTAPVFVVAGGNHVTVLVDKTETGGMFDVIEVLAQPGGGPPAHRHEFVEWFHVLEGELQLSGERGGAIAPTNLVREGESATVGPWEWHATLNESDRPVRFVVVGRPGLMTGYFAEAGVAVADERTPPDREPAGPAALTEIAARYGIRFWGGAQPSR
jgi:quercetin dioxygenase-like cupin family protein